MAQDTARAIRSTVLLAAGLLTLIAFPGRDLSTHIKMAIVPPSPTEGEPFVIGLHVGLEWPDACFPKDLIPTVTREGALIVVKLVPVGLPPPGAACASKTTFFDWLKYLPGDPLPTGGYRLRVLFRERTLTEMVFAVYPRPIDLEEKADITVQAEASQASLGHRMALVDLNGDGRKDLVFAGSTHVLFGSPQGWPRRLVVPQTSSQQQVLQTDLVTKTSTLAGGDFNGDGFDDLIFADVCRQERIYLFMGREAFPPQLDLQREADAIVVGKGDHEPHCPFFEVPGDTLGFALATGDLNGDGLDDLLVRLSGPEAIGVFWGRPEWPEVIDLAKEGPDLLIGGVPGSLLTAVSDFTGMKLGDVNGDGHPDLIVNAPLPSEEPEISRVFVLFGPVTEDVTDLAGSADVTVEGQDFTFWHLAVGDVNGDGRDDLLLGDAGRGRGYLLYGREAWPTRWNLGEIPPDLLLKPENLFLSCLISTNCDQPEPLAIGDLNDDGVGDLLLAAPWGRPPKVYVLYGRADAER